MMKGWKRWDEGVCLVYLWLITAAVYAILTLQVAAFLETH